MVRICLISSVVEEPVRVGQNASKSDDPFEDERRLPFTVVSCSGQDDDFPATELCKGVSGKGWQTRKFCDYPQELVIELQAPAHILTLQLLCHEYKIASKVEIFASVVGGVSNQIKRLGYLSLDSNERTGFQARELKSIQINSPATSLKLLLHSCYPNKLNVYNQVGVVALVVTGETLREDQITRAHISLPSPSESPRIQVPRAKFRVDLSCVDSTTAQRIMRLQYEKDLAVQEEDYDEAKRLKILIGRLVTLGEQIKVLEYKKRLAVEEEDYDQAKQCKLEIEKLRQSDGENLPSITREREHRIPQKKHANVGTSRLEISNSSTQTSVESLYVDDDNRSLLSNSINDEIEVQAHRASQPQPVHQAQLEPVCPLQPIHQPHSARPPSDSHQPRIHPPVSTQPVHQQTAIETQSAQPRPSSSTRPSANEFVNVKPHQDVIAESHGGDEALTPEPLSEALLKQHSDMLIVMDQYHVECLLSKHWQLRDKAIQFLEKELESKSYTSDAIGSFRAVHKVLARGLNDRVSNVLFGSIQALRPYVARYASEVPNREIHSCVGDIIAILLDKMGDSNTRTREAASDTIMYFASVREIGLPIISPLILKVPKTLSVWRPILGRLQWLMTAIPKYGLQPQGRLGSAGFASEALMQFVVHCFNYPNGEVRNAAMKVTTEVYKIIGFSVEKFLKSVKPAIREAVVALFEKSGDEDGEFTAKIAIPSSLGPQQKAHAAKSMVGESIKQLKGSKLTDTTKGKASMDALDRHSMARSSDRFDGGGGRGWDSSSDYSQIHKPNITSSSGRPSCSALRR